MHAPVLPLVASFVSYALLSSILASILLKYYFCHLFQSFLNILKFYLLSANEDSLSVFDLN